MVIELNIFAMFGLMLATFAIIGFILLAFDMGKESERQDHSKS